MRKCILWAMVYLSLVLVGLSACSGKSSTDTPAATDTTSPSVPTGLLVSAISSSQVSLSWNTSTDDVAVTGYNVNRNNNLLGTTATTSYLDSGLTASVSAHYCYTVSAYDSAGNASAASNQACVTIPDPGAAHNFTYHFDENYGAVAVNSDGGGYFDGILYGPSWVPGKLGSALQFGTTLGSRVEIPMQFWITFDNSISIGTWIKLDTIPQSESYHIVGSGYYGLRSFRLQINISGQLEFLLDDNYVWGSIVTSKQILTQGTWYFVAVTYDETTGRIYIDGVEDNSHAISFNIPTSYNTIYIGAIDNDVNASQKFQNQFVGIIDELRISKDLWTPQQILVYYNSTK